MARMDNFIISSIPLLVFEISFCKIASPSSRFFILAEIFPFILFQIQILSYLNFSLCHVGISALSFLVLVSGGNA